jgi:hypothetical protein
MKPTFQISRPSRRIDSARPAGHQISKSPATDWNFQSAADLRGGTVATTPATEQLGSSLSLYGMTQGLFDAETKWEDRIEGFGIILVTFLAAWPVWKAGTTCDEHGRLLVVSLR